MLDQIEFANKLRSLARRSDTFGKDRETILEEIIMMAENYESNAEKMELDYITNLQENPL